MPFGCRPSSPRRCATLVMTLPIIAASIRCSERWLISTRWSNARTRSASRSLSTRSIRTAPTSIRGSGKAGRAATMPKRRLVCLGRRQDRRLAAQQLAVGVRWSGVDVGCAPRTILSAQFPAASSRTSTSTIPRCRTRCWASRGSGSTAVLTASASTPSISRCTIRRCAIIRRRRLGGKRTRPFDFQQHLYNQSHPDIAEFLEQLREVTDPYGGRFTLAEVGGDNRWAKCALSRGQRRLNSAYGFDFLYADQLTPELVAQAHDDGPKRASRLAELGVRKSRCAAGPFALGGGRSTPTISRGPRCCC